MLTVYQTPQELTPGYNSQYFTAYSDQYATPGFKYNVTITVNGDTANAYNDQYLPRPDGWLKFDAKEWVKNYIEHYFNPDLSLTSCIEIATNKSVLVEVVISEYGISPFQSETITYQAFDACLTEDDFRNYDFSDYIFNGTTGKYFLSKNGTSIFPDNRIVLGQDVWLHFINSPYALVDSIVLTQRRGNTIIGGYSITPLPTPVNNYDMYVMNVSSGNFPGAAVGDIVGIDFRDSGDNSIYKLIYTIQSICTKFTDYVLYYLDRDGNILSFHFEFKSTINYTKKENIVRLDKNTLNTTTGEYGSNSWDREDNIVSTAIESIIGLNTGWITEAQSLQLIELWSSPLVWIWDGSILKACRITNNGYEQKFTANERLFNYDVSIDLGITETVQRGI